MTEPYQLIRTRRRTIALIVQNDGRLVVRAPLLASETTIQIFVESKAGWIRKKQAQVKETLRVTGKQYREGEHFWYLGKVYPLLIVAPHRPTLDLKTEFRLSSSARHRAARTFVRWYRTRAAAVLAERVPLLALKHGYHYLRIRITSARTRWGSCSPNGTLSFPWRLVMAPLEVIDYVIVHELVHLKVKDHSPAFWAQLGSLLPHYRTQVAWLKKNGRFLSLGD